MLKPGRSGNAVLGCDTGELQELGFSKHPHLDTRRSEMPSAATESNFFLDYFPCPALPSLNIEVTKSI